MDHIALSNDMCTDWGLQAQADDLTRRSCMVEGCFADLADHPKYCQSKRLCAGHIKASCVQRRHCEGLWRFCQQCGKLEPVSAFEGNKRSCKRQLAKRRAAMAKAGNSATEKATTASEPLPKCSPTSVNGSEPGDSAGPEEPQPVNDYLQQQLMLYQQKCDFIKRQIRLLEEQHGSLAALGNQAQLLPGAAGSAGNDALLAAQCAAPAGSPTGQQLTGVCLQHSPSGVHMQAGAGSGVWAQGSFTSSACAPVTRSGSSISTTTNVMFHAGGASTGMLSPPPLQHTISSSSSMLASSSPMGVSGGPSSEPMAGWMPPCSSMPHMGSGDSSFWQQATQQAMYSPEQSLASLPAGMSAPLPAWCGVAGQQVVPCGVYSNSQQLPSPGVAAAPPTPLIIVGPSHEAADEDAMDMDSAETIADILEMALLEAGVEARMASGGFNTPQYVC